MRKALPVIAVLLLLAAIVYAATISDDFNRADGGLGADYGSQGTGLVIASNGVQSDTASSSRRNHYVGGFSFGNDQFSQVQLTTFTGSAASYIMDTVRVNTTGDQFRYRCMAARNDPYYGSITSAITVFDGVGENLIASESSTTWVAGDILRCSANSDVISLRRNGVELLSVPDSTLSTGSVGLEIYTEESTLTNVKMDNLLLGDYEAVVPPATVLRRRAVIVQ